MAGVKISNLPAATVPLTGTELIAVVQGGATKQSAIGGTIPAAQIINTPTGTIAATNVQTAINEIVTDLSASSGASLVGFIQTGTGATARTVQAKERDSVSVLDFGADPTNSTDSTTAFTNAIAAALLAGASPKINIPQGTYIISSTLVIPARISIVGAGRGSTFINYSGSSSLFTATGVSGWTLSDFRIYLGTSATAVALTITGTVTTPVYWAKVCNIEIAGGTSGVAGQKGIRAVGTGGSYVQNCWFEDINLFYVDKPIERTNTETCTWRGIEISQFGFTASTSAINGTSNDDYMQAHVGLGPGIGAGGSIAYTQAGNYNIDNITADIQAGGNTALGVSGLYNTITLARPAALTPIGTIDQRNNLLDPYGQKLCFGAITGAVTNKTLIDYEEGAWTPTVASGSGTITTLGTLSGTYTKIGRQVTLFMSIAITTNGTGATSINVGNLPYAISSRFLTCVGCGRETAVSGKSLQAIGSSTTQIGVFNYDNTYPGANGAVLVVEFVYETT